MVEKSIAKLRAMAELNRFTYLSTQVIVILDKNKRKLDQFSRT